MPIKHIVAANKPGLWETAMARLVTDDELESFKESLKQVFFDAMNVGYAAEERSVGALETFPGSRHVVYEDGRFRVTDTWETTPRSNFSGGTTRIYYDDELVWMMQYFGEYNKEAIPYLKTALGTTYAERTFMGGRGLRHLTMHKGDLTYLYENHVEVGASGFGFFHGFEEVRIFHGASLGWHRYHGGLMIGR